MGSFVICFKLFNYFMENCGNGATEYGVRARSEPGGTR